MSKEEDHEPAEAAWEKNPRIKAAADAIESAMRLMVETGGRLTHEQRAAVGKHLEDAQRSLVLH